MRDEETPGHFPKGLCVACPVEDEGQCPDCGCFWYRDSAGCRRGYRVVELVPARRDEETEERVARILRPNGFRSTEDREAIMAKAREAIAAVREAEPQASVEERVQIADRASRECKALRDATGKENVPLQSVYEALCRAQYEAQKTWAEAHGVREAEGERLHFTDEELLALAVIKADPGDLNPEYEAAHRAARDKAAAEYKLRSIAARDATLERAKQENSELRQRVDDARHALRRIAGDRTDER